MWTTLYQYRFRPERVIDGDTVSGMFDLGFNTFQREGVRLFGINAPEMATGLEGLRAKYFVCLWLMGEGSPSPGQDPLILRNAIAVSTGFRMVTIDSVRYDAREKYGRCLGKLYRDGDTEDLSAALLRNGLAKPATY